VRGGIRSENDLISEEEKESRRAGRPCKAVAEGKEKKGDFMDSNRGKQKRRDEGRPSARERRKKGHWKLREKVTKKG